MHFESVTACAFGPFCDRTLDLTPGMNVVYGPNESGKSSWHAALYAGLCGVRHGKGPPKKQEKEFERRRKPWQGTDRWNVSVVVTLADGRRVALRQDLAAKAGQAQDADLADKDYSAEINSDGTVDGARWLGLNRTSFLNTGCVRQAEMLRVREGAAGLQNALQKAADKADKDATAAQALAELANYRKAQIGSLIAPTKPRRVAKREVDEAHDRLESARDHLAEYIEQQRQAKKLEAEVEAHRQRIRAVRALQAERNASEATTRLQRVRDLSEPSVDGPPTPSVDDADLADQVAAAIAAWDGAPDPQGPQGATYEELDEQRSAVQAEKRRLDSVQPKQRLKALPLLFGLGLLAVAGTCFWAQTMVLLFLGGMCVAVGLGTVWWGMAQAKRTAAETHAAQLVALTERLSRLEDQINRRRVDDLAYSNAMRRRQADQQTVHRAATAAGVRESGTSAQVRALRGWQEKRRARLERLTEKTKRWGELQSALAGQSLEEIERVADAQRAEADARLRECDEVQLDDARTVVDDLPQLLHAEQQAQRRLDQTRGSLRAFADGMPSVADAEDDYEDVIRRLKRLNELDGTLETATEFLEKAQERVHRDVAGVLRRTLLEWLPRVTGGRYTDCRIDPQTLSVEVRTQQGDWRNAELLSHGTAEQLYLLLRLALCRHLVADNETCPLILDDPVSACDADRQRLILETLLQISASTQVILFTHDDDALEWGRRRLSPERNGRVIELSSVAQIESRPERLGTRIANRFRGEQLDTPFEEVRGASIRPLDFQ